MPAERTIVELLDFDGDRFPVSLPGSGYSDVAAYRAAMVEAETLIAEGKWRPKGTLVLGSVTDPKDQL